MATIAIGLLLLIVAQVTVPFVNCAPADTIQRIGSPSADENALDFQQEDNHVQLSSLADFGEKYSIGNVTYMIQAMRETVNLMRNGEQGDFLRTRLGEQLFQEINSKLNNSLAETDAIKREAEYLNGKRLQPHVILLRRLIKRFSNTQSRLADSFKDLSAALRTASVGSKGFADGLQSVLLQVYYEFSSYFFKKASEDADHDWRSLARLEPV